MNTEWHEQHVLVRGADVEARVAWHTEHATVCGCRPIPASIKAELRRRDPLPEYLADLHGDRLEIVSEIDRIIRAEAPQLVPATWPVGGMASAGMIGYGRFHYRYASGREGEWFAIGLANQKNYVSVYLCAATPEGYLAERNAKRLAAVPGKVSVGKSCIRFKQLDHLDRGVFAELVAETADLVADGSGGV